MRLPIVTAGIVALIVAAAGSAAPPVAPHVVVAQPASDGVVLEGYAAGVPVTVQVLRGGNLVNQVTVTPAPVAGGGGGGAPEVVGEVNNLEGGSCWPNFTPDITDGDVVRVLSAGLAEDATVQHLTISQAQATGAGEVTVTGSAETPSGTPLDVAGLEHRFTGPFPDAAAQFRRLPGDPGVLDFNPPGTSSWRARHTTLGVNDEAIALTAPSVVSWTSAGATEVTEVEFGSAPGPQGACATPLRTNAATSATPPAYGFAATTLAVHGIAELAATDVTVTIADAAPTTPNVVLGPASLTTTGGGKAWTLTASATQVRGLVDGTLTATPRFTIGGNAVTGDPLTLVKDLIPPDLTAPSVTFTSVPKARANSRVAVFNFQANEPGRLECALDGAPFTSCTSPVVFSALNAGARRFAVRAIDGAGNVGTSSTHDWTIDLVGPRVTAGIPVANRVRLTKMGRLTARVRCNETCRATVTARLAIGGFGQPVSTRRSVALTVNRTGNVSASFRPAQLAALRQALRRGQRVRINVAVIAVDLAGNRTRTARSITISPSDLR